MDFDPMRDTKFRGKSLDQLSREEAIEALSLALKRVHYLELVGAPRHLDVWPVFQPRVIV